MGNVTSTTDNTAVDQSITPSQPKSKEDEVKPGPGDKIVQVKLKEVMKLRKLEKDMEASKSELEQCETGMMEKNKVEEELRDAVSDLKRVNVEYKKENADLTDKLNTDAQRYQNEIKCGTASCTQLVNEKNRLEQYIFYLRQRLSRAEQNQVTLKQLIKNESTYKRKLAHLTILYKNEVEQSKRLRESHQKLNLQIGVLQTQLRKSNQKGLEQSRTIDSLQRKRRELESLLQSVPPKMTVDEYVTTCETKLKSAIDEQQRLKKKNNLISQQRRQYFLRLRKLRH